MKHCPNCNSTVLVQVYSQQLVNCNDCGQWSPWPLEDGRAPLLANNRDKRPADKRKD